jgi:hypothetical protein
VNTSASFIDSLMDFSFTAFVTSKIIRLLYGLSIVGAALMGLILVVFGFSVSWLAGIVMLLFVAPLVFIISVIYSRVLLEIIIVIFRISEHAAEIAANTRRPV